MIDKRGYTLIELLSTITIMTLVATIASFNIVRIFDDKEALANKQEESIITEAACVYIELEKNKDLKASCLNIGCDINTSTLINEGLLDEQDVSKNKVIHITKENNEKKCNLKEG